MAEEQTLLRNSIKKFILKIDLLPLNNLKHLEIVDKLAPFFTRVESRNVSNFAINLTTTNTEIKENKVVDFVLVNTEYNYTVTISEPQNSIYFETSNYTNSNTYRNFIEILNEVLTLIEKPIQSKRIGLRYVNEFNCESPRQIASIFSTRLSKIIKIMLTADGLSRIIGLEEYNSTMIKSRLQYGIPNKHYPAPILKLDFLLDIDCYIDSTEAHETWPEAIKNINHSAYEHFINSINPQFIEKLK
ncbi:MAG TPA: TIGR04255 family protein [Geothrix sp.]|jgi:uncharacterized protein (TIGR04255 family)